MINITIDGKKLEIEPGKTILDAARNAGIEIPTMCFLDGHRAETSCMVCVVKVDGKPRLVPSCATRVRDGMVVESETEEVRTARRTAIELLLSDHVGDCVGPCQSGCPAHMDIPAMLSMISERRFHEALILVKQHIALPAILGRICPEICEHGCRRQALDSPISICLLKRFVADLDLASKRPYLPEKRPSSGKTVGIIGAGPAGLAAAYYLQQQGHQCVLHDDHPEPGGILRYAIEAERLPHSVIDAEVALIRELGAEFRMGKRVEFGRIQGEFDATLIATGQIDAATAESFGLQSTPHGLKTDRASMMTSVSGVFAAGSVIAHTQHAVRSVSEGRSAATAITRFLAGDPPIAKRNPYSVHIGKLMEGELALLKGDANSRPRIVHGESGLTEEQAVAESERCFHCECGKLHNCKLRDYAAEYQANQTRFKHERERIRIITDHPLVTYEPGKCISCGLCVQLTERSNEPLGLAFMGRGFAVRPGVPFGERMEKALEKVAIECVNACPTGALSAKRNAKL
jgi:ferredoxin